MPQDELIRPDMNRIIGRARLSIKVSSGPFTSFAPVHPDNIETADRPRSAESVAAPVNA